MSTNPTHIGCIETKHIKSYAQMNELLCTKQIWKVHIWPHILFNCMRYILVK